MRAGIIAEGRADLAVLRNVLEGCLGVARDEVRFLVPEYDEDATDRHAMANEQRSSWLRVRDECRSGARIREFLELHADDDPIVVVQIDAAEAAVAGYDVARPDRADPALLSASGSASSCSTSPRNTTA